ncbi:MAG: hypothetical protein GY842_09510 [bacterium]|nr:hypothetical protein [bacterium]
MIPADKCPLKSDGGWQDGWRPAFAAGGCVRFSAGRRSIVGLPIMGRSDGALVVGRGVRRGRRLSVERDRRFDDTPVMETPGGVPLTNSEFIALLSHHCTLAASYRTEDDRRSTCRFHVEDKAVPTVVRAGEFTAVGWLSNISSGGVRVISDGPAATDARIELDFAVGGDHYSQHARVVRCQEHGGHYVMIARFEDGPFLRKDAARAARAHSVGRG